MPGFENNEEEAILPGFENNDEETMLPGFENNETTMPEVEDDKENVLPGFDENKVDEQYTNVLNNLRRENEQEAHIDNPLEKSEKEEYPELDIYNIIKSNQKLVAFVGTSKNGTSFLVNNVAEILSFMIK